MSRRGVGLRFRGRPFGLHKQFVVAWQEEDSIHKGSRRRRQFVVLRQACWQHRTAPELKSTGHSRSENPDLCVNEGLNGHSNDLRLTGMPEFVLIPAPVTTMIFFDRSTDSATCCRSSSESGRTSMVGMLGCSNIPRHLLDGEIGWSR